MKKIAAKFITIEGIEGVGKSTHMSFIADYLRQQHISAITTREPGGTPLAEDIRQLVLQPRTESVACDTELLLMFASRAQHVANLILPTLARGDWVICDRFLDATFAYQGGGRKLSLERIEQLTHWLLGSFLPDLTILLDAPVVIATARAKARALATDRFESEQQEFFTRVREVYLARATAYPERIKIIDASQSLIQVQENIVTVLNEFMK